MEIYKVRIIVGECSRVCHILILLILDKHFVFLSSVYKSNFRIGACLLTNFRKIKSPCLKVFSFFDFAHLSCMNNSREDFKLD